jgi:hypothetical protein
LSSPTNDRCAPTPDQSVNADPAPENAGYKTTSAYTSNAGTANNHGGPSLALRRRGARTASRRTA